MRGMTILLLVGCLMTSSAALAQDKSQRPLPFPDKNVPGTTAQRELLRQLRAFLDQQQKQTAESAQQQPVPTPNEQKSPGDSQLDPSQLGQLGDALQKLKDQLPPGMIPPSLGNMPADKLQKSLSNPETQQRMRKLLEQFQRDGLLPPSANGSEQPPLPVPPGSNDPSEPEPGTQNEPSTGGDKPKKSESNSQKTPNGQDPSRRPTNDREPTDDDLANPPLKNDDTSTEPGENDRPNSPGTPDENNNDTPSPIEPSRNGQPQPLDDNSRETTPGGSSPNENEQPQVPKVPISSLRALEDFLEQLSRSANEEEIPGETSPGSESPGSDSSNSDSPAITPPQGIQNPSDPRLNSPGGSQPSPRQPLRRRDPANPTADPRRQPSNRPGTNPPTGSERQQNSPIGNQPSPGSNPQNPPLEPMESSPGSDVPNDREPSREQQSQQAIENLQKLLQNESLRRQAEQMLNGEQPPGAPGGNPFLNPRGSQSVPGQNDPQSPNSQPQSSRPGSESNRNNSQGTSPSTRPNQQTPDQKSVEDFIREQMKKIQSQPGMQDPAPRPSGNANQPSPSPRTQDGRSNPGGQNPDPNTQRNQSAQTPPATNPNSNPDPKTPPIDIAEEVNRRGLKNTLKKIWENAKEQSRNEEFPMPNSPNGAPGTGNGIDLKDVPADRLLKMLDNFSDDLEKLAKESEQNPRSDRSGRVMSQPPRQTPEPPSAISELRKSASEWLSDAMPTKPSQNSGPRSTPTGMSMPSLSADFDMTPVIILATLLGLAGIALIAGRFVKNRAAANADAALAALGPPLTPDQIHNRSDVVRAFHQVALKAGHAVEDWWNHRDAATSLASASPQNQTAVATLAEAYEHARYLPDDIPLPNEKIENARAAVRSLS